MLLRGLCRQSNCVACGASPSITAASLPQYDYAAFTGQPANDKGPPSLHVLPTNQRWVTEAPFAQPSRVPSVESAHVVCTSQQTLCPGLNTGLCWGGRKHTCAGHLSGGCLCGCALQQAVCAELQPRTAFCLAAPAQIWLWKVLSCCSPCRVTPAELQWRLQAQRPALVDVRPRPEFDMAHLPGDLYFWLTSRIPLAAKHPQYADAPSERPHVSCSHACPAAVVSAYCDLCWSHAK